MYRLSANSLPADILKPRDSKEFCDQYVDRF